MPLTSKASRIARIVARRRARPVARALLYFGHGRLQRRLVALQAEAEDPGEGILRHARGQPLHLRRRKIRQAVSRRLEGFVHNSLPLQWVAIMQIWVDADACPGVIKEILFRAAARHSLPPPVRPVAVGHVETLRHLHHADEGRGRHAQPLVGDQRHRQLNAAWQRGREFP